MEEQDLRFRAEIIKIQNLLSDEDRKQLHFIFGEDIPRRLQDGSLNSALDAMQTLLDRLKISPTNVGYLTNALRAIERHDCAQRLEDYEKLIPQYVIQFQPAEHQQLRHEQRQTLNALLMDYNEKDSMSFIQTESKPTSFTPPEPVPLDLDNISLKPFEDASEPWTKEYSKSLNLPYHPRNYQIEIIRHTISNGNSIICLRTGSGKTFIASVLIKYYYIKKLKENPQAEFLTLFFVPRKAIRLQQAQAIANIGNLRVQICEDDQRVDQLLNNNVIISTPQKCVNSLKTNAMNLSQIDLIIFDECHNTIGKNPFCEIMKYYLCPTRNQSNERKPSIIGLTATISAKDSGEKNDTVMQNLVSLCSKHGCYLISTVCDENNIEELDQEISRPQNNQFEFVLPVEYNEYFKQYLELYKNLIQRIKVHLRSHETLDVHAIGSSGFIGQLINLKHLFECQGNTNDIIICDYLLLLTKKYSAFNDLPFDSVLRYIYKQIDDYHKAYTQPSPMNELLFDHCKIGFNDLIQKHTDHPTTNSKLNYLVQLLKTYAPNGQKGLILVQTTFYAKTLHDYIKNHPELTSIVRPSWIVGQNSSDYSLTINEQEQHLKLFRENQCNVLVATDIVQEGLDIPTCSYVIRYEFVSDEVGTIQSRGRARAQNSSYYLITEKGSTNHKREENNKKREDEMEAAITNWRHIDKEGFRVNVTEKTKQLIDQWEKEIKTESAQQAALKNLEKKPGSIHCSRCNKELGRFNWLRRRNTAYFINEPEFLEKNDCPPDETPKAYQEILSIGKVNCTCGNPLGGCQKFIDRLDLGTLCALKCGQIKFKFDGEENYLPITKWSQNPFFAIEEIEEI